MSIGIELTRAVDGPGVAAALAACGLDSVLSSSGLALVVQGDDQKAVVHCLDGWLSERRLPFVPVRVTESSFALVPPAG